MSIEQDPVTVGGVGAGVGALLFALARKLWNGKAGVPEELCRAHRDGFGRSIDQLRVAHEKRLDRLEIKLDNLPDRIVARLKE